VKAFPGQAVLIDALKLRDLVAEGASLYERNRQGRTTLNIQ
jgi:hypothetical protein